MKTPVLKINPRNPEKEKIKMAASILKRGGLVAFPTDTVYGLGADVRNSRAVKKIFAVKNRPRTNPLPILIAKKSDLKKYTLGASAKIKKLTDKFWPGPLTITLKKKKIISDAVTAGKKTVGVRVPKNPVALALIKTLGRPLATTSANIASKQSPTTARGVKKYLNNKIDLILDGGKTKLSRESTVLNCTTSPPIVLRSGAIAGEKIEKIIGKIEK
ncbi:threonylcarbamoyl-AMP synthase [Candidatus Falkowbacteria bacterium]|nr:threonylcarbamoyl-AMP synthase [Candidatus Falkowbacteria bacterium]